LTYDAVAWVIYNRVKSGNYRNTAKEVCLQNGQFVVWRSLWNKSDIPSNTESTGHQNYGYCLEIAKKIASSNKPTDKDPTNGALNFRTTTQGAKKSHPNGIEIGGNWFFK
jgi:hypothetical protein